MGTRDKGKRGMNIADYYNQGNSIKDCSRKFNLTERTAMDKIRDLGVDVDMPITPQMYKTYEKKIRVVRALFGYETIDMEDLKKKDYDTYFFLSWAFVRRSLTGKTG